MKRNIKGHQAGGYAAKQTSKIETTLYVPKQLMPSLILKWNETPANVSFSAFLVGLIEAGLEEL